MYELFLNNNSEDKKLDVSDNDLIENVDIETKALFSECGGCSFNKGLYRVHTPNSSVHWSIIISKYFPKYDSKIIPFGYDWLGRQYVVDSSREDCILMFDPATAEDFGLKKSLRSFHNDDLVHDRNNVLAESAFCSVINQLGLNRIAYDNCVSHKVSLFLGGNDDINNYEICDVEVNWEFQFQIYLQIRDLPPGTKINSVKVKYPK